MKKIALIIIASFLFFPYGHGQKSKDSLRYLNDYDLGSYYLKKSKKQKTIGWVLLGAGVTLTIVGAQQVANDIFSESSGGEVSMLIGNLSTIASIPLFLSAAKHRGRAEILLRSQNIPVTRTSGTRLLSVGVAIPLRN